jgi:hypothetical protein
MRVGLDGRAVIVTGAAIGMAIAAEAAASGAALLLTDHARVSYSLGARTSR